LQNLLAAKIRNEQGAALSTGLLSVSDNWVSRDFTDANGCFHGFLKLLFNEFLIRKFFRNRVAENGIKSRQINK